MSLFINLQALSCGDSGTAIHGLAAGHDAVHAQIPEGGGQAVTGAHRQEAVAKRRNNTASQNVSERKKLRHVSLVWGRGEKHETNFTDGAAESASGSVDVVPASTGCSPVLVSTSHATLDCSSCFRHTSKIASAIW